jgi:tRNA A37 threonylcarbamoyladenosine modification protein TsaB
MAAAALAARDLGPVPVAACYDALRGEVYGAVYVVFPGRVETLVAPAVVTLAALAARAPVRPRLAVGDGAVRYAAEVRAWLGAPPVAVEELPGGGALAATLLSLVPRDGAARLLDDGLTAEPVYGRLAEAQVKWEARHGRPLSDSRGPDR